MTSENRSRAWRFKNWTRGTSFGTVKYSLELLNRFEAASKSNLRGQRDLCGIQSLSDFGLFQHWVMGRLFFLESDKIGSQM
jgi:hypothetical protein